jgi:rSAM/selenodomain-associated transferase 1
MDQLGVFAKYWQPGQVKTRLAATLGLETASRFYLACLRTLLGRMAYAASRRVLAFWPPQREDEFRELARSEWTLQPQAEGDLGRRMQAYFEHALDARARRVVLLGSDSPTLPLEFVGDAFRRLETARVVLGPSADGGYYLLGISGDMPPIFENIAWSTPAVWRETVSRLQSAGVPYDTLPEWYDVDEPDDLARLQSELTAPQADPWLAELREEMARLGL